MAQAALDPAVLDAAAPAEATDVDALLSQMAGEEVDRLLAEAEAERSAAAQAAANPTPPPPPASPAGAEAQSAQIDDLLLGLQKSDASTPPDSPQVTGEIVNTDEALAAQLDNLMAELTEPAKAVEGPLEPTPHPMAVAAPIPPAALETEEARLKALAAELEVDQPQAANVAVTAVAAAGAPAEAAVESDAPIAADPEVRAMPVLLRPLVWLNAPLANAPELVRSLVGKAAIVTFVNAAAMGIYVLISKRHH